jgi:hypothetical protein
VLVKRAIFYDRCKLHLLSQGSATCVDNCIFTWSDDADNTFKAVETAKGISYQQKLLATMVTLGLWQDNCNLAQPEQILLVKKFYIIFVECSIARIF